MLKKKTPEVTFGMSSHPCKIPLARFVLDAEIVIYSLDQENELKGPVIGSKRKTLANCR